jgi:hypothetical protein
LESILTREWIDEMRVEAKERVAAGIGMENPNEQDHLL